MYYNQSLQILERIRSAKNILINIHKNPDLDSIGSATALIQLLNQLDKKGMIVAGDKSDESLLIFPETKKIRVIDYAAFNFSKYDLFLVLDSSSHDRVTGSKKIFLPKISTIVIDHHRFNSVEGEIKLVDVEVSATAEIIYKLTVDAGLKIDKKLATRLYCGIVGDTVFFKYGGNLVQTIGIAFELLKKGADHQFVIDRVVDNMDFKFAKLMGLFLEKMEIKKTKLGKQFVWAAVSYKECVKFGAVKGAREAAADNFFRSIAGVDFGLAMTESKPGEINISFRSKSKTDVAAMAKFLGGGGHTNAAGATIEGDYEKTIKDTLDKIIINY